MLKNVESEKNSDKVTSRLENKLKWALGATVTFGLLTVFGLGYTFHPIKTKNFPNKPSSVKRYNLTEKIIRNIDQNNQPLTKGAYFIGDPLLNEFCKQQLELDSLTINRYEEFILPRIEKEPEYIEYNNQLSEFTKDTGKKMVNRGLASSIFLIGSLFSYIGYRVLNYKKNK